MSSALIVAVWPFPVPPPYRGKLPIAQQPVGAVAIRFRSCKDTTFSQHSQKKLLGVYGVHTTSASGGRCGFCPLLARRCVWQSAHRNKESPNLRLFCAVFGQNCNCFMLLDCRCYLPFCSLLPVAAAVAVGWLSRVRVGVLYLYGFAPLRWLTVKPSPSIGLVFPRCLWVAQPH